MQQGMIVKPGTKLYGAGTECEVVVVRPSATDVTVACAGAPMVNDPDQRHGEAADPGGDILIGKRYRHQDSGLELLCTRSGTGPLTVDGVELQLVESRPLPASD